MKFSPINSTTEGKKIQSVIDFNHKQIVLQIVEIAPFKVHHIHIWICSLHITFTDTKKLEYLATL